MLTQITRLNHVGLFRHGVQQPVRLQRATLFYGENGRGKSTLSAVLDSYAKDRPALIQCRATIDEQNPNPEVTLVFQGRPPVTYSGGQWSARPFDVLVFDSQFVHDNVYTGIEVTADNRKGLYTFAIGESARDLEELERLNIASREANQTRNECQQALRGIAAPLTVEQFVEIVPDPNIHEQLRAARRELDAAERNAQIAARSDLEELVLPDLVLANTFTLLNRTVDDLNAAAVALVQQHIARHDGRGFERWISQGLSYRPDEECPFCGQPTAHLGLLSAFGAYFGEAFRLLTDEVRYAQGHALQRVGPAAVTAIRTSLTTNSARRQTWLDLVQSDEIVLDIERIQADAAELYQLLDRLFEEKQGRVFEKCGRDEDHRRATELQASISNRLQTYNSAVRALNERFAARKQELAQSDVNGLRERAQLLEVHERRGRLEIQRAVDNFVEARRNAEELANAKAALRQTIDMRMEALLPTYQAAINARLAELFARFRIVNLDGTHPAGQAPRAGYALELRGIRIDSLSAADDRPSFATALSDGDRRTLALAFFLARLDVDGRALEKIVIFDDPMASLDVNRKEKTVGAIVDIASRCAQTIVLSHDPFFLHQLETEFRNEGTAFLSHKIGHHGNDAAFSEVDLHQICQSGHVGRYKLVHDYMRGPPQNNQDKVAGQLRILVEGYYKLRFPTIASPEMNLSSIRTAIREAPPNFPHRRA